MRAGGLREARDVGERKPGAPTVWDERGAQDTEGGEHRGWGTEVIGPGRGEAGFREGMEVSGDPRAGTG